MNNTDKYIPTKHILALNEEVRVLIVGLHWQPSDSFHNAERSSFVLRLNNNTFTVIKDRFASPVVLMSTIHELFGFEIKPVNSGRKFYTFATREDEFIFNMVADKVQC